MKLKKSERKLLEKRKQKLIDCIDVISTLEDEGNPSMGCNEFGVKFILPSTRYLSKVVDSLIYTRLDFVNKDGSEIGGPIPVELVTGPDVELGTPLVTEENLVVG